MERVGAPEAPATVADPVVAPARDATSWLVFRSGGAAIQAGEYVMTGRFRLDVGAERPVLMRGGSSTVEINELRLHVA